MQIADAYPSEYLKASDLQGRAVNVTISHVDMAEVGRDKEQKPVLYFRGKEKVMVLNKTNANKIAEMFGGNTDDWAGGEIVLYETMVDFQGRTFAAIRVRLAPRKSNVAVNTPAPRPPASEIINDTLPDHPKKKTKAKDAGSDLGDGFPENLLS